MNAHERRLLLARTRNRVKTQPAKEATLVISVILWIIGVADLVLGVINLPNHLGLWSLVLAGLLLIIGSLVTGI
jgi:hypothetical protein